MIIITMPSDHEFSYHDYDCVGMRTLCWNNFGNNRMQKESGIANAGIIVHFITLKYKSNQSI